MEMWKAWSATALVVALAFGAAIGSAAAQETPDGGLPVITVAPVETAVLTDRIRTSGRVEAVERVIVQPQVEGQAVDALLVDVGDRVEAGAVLARLSETALAIQKTQLEASRASAEASIAQAEAQLVEAEAVRDEAVRDRDRTASLADQGATTRAAADEAAANAASASARATAAARGLDYARAQLRLVEAQTADVELQLRRTLVTAPVAGEVVERNALVGAIASASGEPMFVIVRDAALELRADVTEADMLRLAAGQRATIRFAGAVTSPGRVRIVEPQVDADTRLGRVRIPFDRIEGVRAGMFAEAEVIVVEREGLALPTSAVSGRGAEATVLRVADGVVELVPVTVGVRDGDRVEILEGLASGDEVVARAGAFVRPGDRIAPRREPAATSAEGLAAAPAAGAAELN